MWGGGGGWWRELDEFIEDGFIYRSDLSSYVTVWLQCWSKHCIDEAYHHM